jgi:hypothetical protein
MILVIRYILTADNMVEADSFLIYGYANRELLLIM